MSALVEESTQIQVPSDTGRRRQLAVLVVALAFVMDLMDATLLTIALPTIERHMHASLSALNWMATAYPLTFAVLLVTGGRLGDVLGYRRLFLAGVTLFGLASMLVGAAWSPDALIVARLAQGAAAALMVPQVLSVIQQLYKPDERTAIAGMLGGLTMLATTVAPIVTAVLIKANLLGLSWRPIFFINLPVCVAALALAPRYLPAPDPARHQQADLIGGLLVVGAVFLMVFPLIQGRTLHWPIWCFVMLAASVVVFAIFARRQRRLEAAEGCPLVSPSLFRRRSFTVGLAISLLITATIACFGLTFSLVLQSGHRFSALHTVLTALFMTVGMTAVAGPLSKKVIPAMGRWSLTAGAITMAAGVAVIAANASHTRLSTWQLAPGLAVLGAGMALTFVPLLPYILASVTPNQTGAASGVANAVQQIGGTFGFAVLGAIFFNRLADTGNYGHAFWTAAIVQIVLLALCAALSLALPRRIATEAYKPTL